MRDYGIFETGEAIPLGPGGWSKAVTGPVRHGPFRGRNRTPNPALFGPEAEYVDVAPSSVQAPRPPHHRTTLVHSPEKPSNSAEIDRILKLELEIARLKAQVAAGATQRREAESALADSEE